MGHIDRKITIWQRHYFNDKDISDIIGDVKYIDENFVNEMIFSCEDNEFIIESCEEISFEENNNQRTIEVYNRKGDMIWSNEPIYIKREKKINDLI